MLRNFCVLIVTLICSTHLVLSAYTRTTVQVDRWQSEVDTGENDLSKEQLNKFANFRNNIGAVDTINMNAAKLQAFSNLADFLKGQVAGLFVQKPSGEPGAYQNILIRGANSPIFDNTSLNKVRPVIFVNGIPLVTSHDFAYNIQSYKFNRIGPETDYLNFIDVNSIQNIEVVKDPVQLALLGPLAANGAILITTFGGKSGNTQFSVNSYFGFNAKPSITPVNAQYENLFRKPFYALYNNTEVARQLYPSFLADSTNLNYYGASNWKDEYYRNAPLYSIDLSVRGGSDRANFGFVGGHSKSSSTADNTQLDRYNALLNINMLPFSWFTVSSFINASRTERNRNRNFRDRYAEIGYLPELSTPISPNLVQYRNLLNSYTKVVDDNITNNILGSISLSIDIIQNLNYTTTFLGDYSEGIRDLFYPSELMETVNYNSSYFGYAQRYAFTNRIRYNFEINKKHNFSIYGGIDYLDDLYRYNYAKGFDGPDDYINLNLVAGSSGSPDYLLPQGGLKVYRWYSTERNRLFSIYGKISYNYKSIFEIDGLLRWDGSSSVQPDNRWLFAPSASARWNLDKYFDLSESFFLKLSAGRIGKIQADSRIAAGPQYAPNLNWLGESSISSYYGQSALSRPYSSGWVGYGIGWNYVDQIDFTIQKSFLQNRLSANLSFYQRENKNQIVLIPVPEEYGYIGQYKSGLNVRNQGFDFSLLAHVFNNPDNINWTTSLNFNYNQNKVTALPDGLSRLVIGNRLLEVGKPADAFWVYENQGIYKNSSDVPVSGNTIFNFEGIPFSYGDPKWVDQNNDFSISENDKILKGNSLPKVFGGFYNKLSYKNIDLSIDLSFALGQKALNERASVNYNFINTGSNNSISSIREIFQWQQQVDITKYPLYNVWSDVDAYREDQDLFLENASYLKIRGITVGYTLTESSFLAKWKSLRKAYIYATVNNAYTITNFSGGDPELININGYYDGYGLPLTPTFSFGFKLDF